MSRDGVSGRGVIRVGWKIPEHGANFRWEVAASSAGDVGAYPMLPLAVIFEVATNVDR